MAEDVITRNLREVDCDHAAYSIAWGLARLFGSAEQRQEGAEMLRAGLTEALLLLTAPPK